MILVSIASAEEKFVILLRHKINYVVEKKFGRTKSLTKNNPCVCIIDCFQLKN